MDTKSLKAKLTDLSPWHFKIEVKDGIYTSDYNKRAISVVDPTNLETLIRKIHPKGLDGKRFLDIGCNGGGYVFLANKMGADYAYGFDIRDHWINQAKFLRDDVFKLSKRKVDFAVHHLSDLNKNKPFDFVVFKGVFYHVPNPIGDLQKVCELTTEDGVILLDTAGSKNAPDNCMEAFFERPSALMAGVDKLAWLPGSPKVVEHIFHWLGFKETRVIFCKDYAKQPDRIRMRIIAARNKKALRIFDRKMAKRAAEAK